MKKTCVFCGASGAKITKEHAWPNWIRKLFAAGETKVIGFRTPNAKLGEFTYATQDDMGVTVNVVCKKCNEGWMHDLEDAVRAFLEPVIRDGATTTFTPHQQTVLATWATKTAMVFEFAGKSVPFFTADERDDLRRRLFPPSYIMTWLAHYSGPFMSLSYGARMTFDEDRTMGIGPLQAQGAVIAVGQLAFQVLGIHRPASGMATIPVHGEWDEKLMRIWPPTNPKTWPPALALNDDGIDNLLRRFDFTRDPDVTTDATP